MAFYDYLAIINQYYNQFSTHTPPSSSQLQLSPCSLSSMPSYGPTCSAVLSCAYTPRSPLYVATTTLPISVPRITEWRCKAHSMEATGELEGNNLRDVVARGKKHGNGRWNGGKCCCRWEGFGVESCENFGKLDHGFFRISSIAKKFARVCQPKV